MKHYFLIAKDVGDLTTILCGALEMQQLKSAPSYKRLSIRSTGRRGARSARERDFRIDNDRLERRRRQKSSRAIRSI